MDRVGARGGISSLIFGCGVPEYWGRMRGEMTGNSRLSEEVTVILKQPFPERDAHDAPLLCRIIFCQDYPAFHGLLECIVEFPEAFELPLRNLVGVTDIECHQGVAGCFYHEIHLTVPFPVIRDMAGSQKFQKDQVLGKFSFVIAEPERDGVPEPVVDAVNLLVLPCLNLKGIREGLDFEEDSRKAGKVDVIPDRVDIGPEHLPDPPVRVGGGDVGEEVLEKTGKGLLVPYVIGPDDVPVHDAVIVCPEIVLFCALVLLEHDNGKPAFVQVAPEMRGDLVFLRCQGCGIFRDTNSLEAEVLGKVQREDRYGEVPAGEERSDLRVKEAGG